MERKMWNKLQEQIDGKEVLIQYRNNKEIHGIFDKDTGMVTAIIFDEPVMTFIESRKIYMLTFRGEDMHIQVYTAKPVHCNICGREETADNEIRFADLMNKFVCSKCMGV